MRYLSTVILAGLVAVSPAFAATTKAPEYVAMAGASDLYEKMSSELVLKDARSTEVRDFATMMINDHSNTTAQVKAAAGRAGIAVPPPKLMPKQQAMIDELNGASGAARETVYIRQQVAAHQEALALHSGYASGGDNAELRQVATTAVPIIQKHLDMVKKLQPEK